MMSPDPVGVVPQGGAVIFREVDGLVEILMVRPSNGRDEWMFPKGHIEPGERDFQTALREALEETGVIGRLIGAVDEASEFISKNEPVRVRYYVLESSREAAPAEAREHVWLPVSLASEQLTHPSDKRVLRDSLPVIQGFLDAKGRGDPGFREFMLNELQHTTESLLKSEEDGERRFTVFLTLAAGAGAVLAFILGDDSRYEPGTVLVPIVMVLLALQVFGYFVLVRVITRNRMSDNYIGKLKRLRKWFTPSVWDPRRHWVAFDPFEETRKRELSYFGPKKGGWVEVVILVNAIIGGALTSAIVPTTSWIYEGLVSTIGGLVVWVALIALSRRLQVDGPKPESE